MLEEYYDIAKNESFETLFKDTYIGQNPTEERNKYLILKFNFSQVNPQVDLLEESFEEHCTIRLLAFTEKYASFFDDNFKSGILNCVVSQQYRR